jgi:uncharacterized integral membrane protein
MLTKRGEHDVNHSPRPGEPSGSAPGRQAIRTVDNNKQRNRYIESLIAGRYGCTQVTQRSPKGVPHMAREDRFASNTTAGPTVPGPRRPASGQGDTGRSDPGRPEDTGTLPGPQAPAGHTQASADHVLQRTRLSAAWLAVGCFLVILVILLIFIAQNSSSVSISFLGTHNSVPLGVALVLAAVCGALLVMLAGVARIMQLRSRARKHQRVARKAARQ